jgi:hypothetical protein
VETRRECIDSLLVNNSSVKMNYGGRTKMVSSKIKFVQLPSWKTVCKNATHLVDVAEEDIVYMQDGNDIYGFSIGQMFHIIEHESGVNPYTRVHLDRRALQRFLDTYVKPPSTTTTNSTDNAHIIAADDDDQVNQLVLLIEKHLAFHERLCMHCRQHKAKDAVFIETYETDFPIIHFCSSECMAAYSLEEFRAIQI